MKNTFLVPEQRTPHFYLPSHKLSWKQDLSSLKQEFSKEDLAEFLTFYSLAEESPKKAQKKVEKFREKYPNSPAVLNLLTFLYLSRRKIFKANRLIRENYANNPHDLFARINYADLCLRKKKSEAIGEVFNHTYSLTELYPERKTFHVSEFRGFMVVMGFYHLAIGKKEAAECYHYLAAKVDPDHPGPKVLAKKLFFKLKKG
ncbi:tetratricopeptide repeat protein [Candidatus Neptunochlamydia vexilliferae]|uniref:Tetratricopeptide repeat protein n=1 Tax=Candidatus Neptunichlamydia vexilliferae TaxID=1651774 RepID=A0ABS0AZI4_9BACT|nr:hypothetical protein [Candidatus Neptunochlamydia vexilliferae]MBF5059538.1 hypothetical protein [Candidatus Neptunochlamydia vexilliferae]